MRLLDQITPDAPPLRVAQTDGTRLRLTSAADFAPQLAACPLRYVLQDELTKTCAALACSDGLSLMACLELVRLPAERIWIEWRDAPRRAELARTLPHLRETCLDDDGLQAGVLIDCSADGRRGSLRTFWATRATEGAPQVSPIVTSFDFDAPMPQARSPEGIFHGEAIALDVATEAEARLLETEAGLSALLAFLRFRLDASWLGYYQRYARSDTARQSVLRACLGSVATDLPMLIAFALLLNARGGLDARPSDLGRLNRARLARGRRALLDHIEVGMPLAAQGRAPRPAAGESSRSAPRLHHVRGHLVRRYDQLFWRSPHWRGALRLGQVRSRTVSVGL